MNYSTTLLRGRRFIVTGAAGGAGRATARLISQLGGSVSCIGRDPERTEAIKRTLDGGGHDCAISGEYHGIFHAAGVEHVGACSTWNLEKASEIFAPSVDLACELLGKVGRRQSLLRDGGAVVMMSSVAAVCGTAGMTLYAASKAAIEGLVRSAAIEFAPRRIRVNAIRAGGFESPMHARIVSRAPPETIHDYERRHPLGFGHADDIANMAVYLLSDMGKWVTGTCVVCDGGYSCK